MTDLVTYGFASEFAKKDNIHNLYFLYVALIIIDYLSGFLSQLDTLNSRLDGSLRKRAQELRRMTSLLRSELPPESDGHFHVANIHERTVVILTDSPVWTTRLRQLGPRILTILKSSGRNQLLHIRVISRPTQAVDNKPPIPPSKPPRRLSQQSNQLIRQAASYIADDSLRAALLKLADHTTNKNPTDANKK